MQGPYDEAPMWGRAHGYDFDDPRSHHLDRPYAEPPRMRRDYYDDRERY